MICRGPGSLGPATTSNVPVCITQHKIVSGDSCWKLSKNGADLANFLSYNPGIQCDDLTIGSFVCLATSSSALQSNDTTGNSDTIIAAVIVSIVVMALMLAVVFLYRKRMMKKRASHAANAKFSPVWTQEKEEEEF